MLDSRDKHALKFLGNEAS